MRRRIALATLGSLALAPQTLRAQTAREVSVGLTGKTATDWPIYVSDELNYWKRYNVSPQYTFAGSVAATAQQMVAGAVDIGELSSTQTVLAIENGAPLRYFLDRITTPPYALMAKREIKTLDDLKGQTVIIGGPTDITKVFFDMMIKHTHLKPDDVTLTFAGATSARYAALRSGSVGAAMLFPPLDFQAQLDGYHSLANLQSVTKSFPFVGFCVTDKFNAAHPDIVTDFTKAYLRGVRWLEIPANKARAVDILVRRTSVLPESALKTYDELVTQYRVFNTTGGSKPAQFGQVVDALGDLGLLKRPLPPPTKFYDNRFAIEAGAQLARESR